MFIKEYSNVGPFSLAKIARELGASVYKSGKSVDISELDDIKITQVSSIAHAEDSHITFCFDKKHEKDLSGTSARACLVSSMPGEINSDSYYVVLENVHVGYVKLVELFYPMHHRLDGSKPKNVEIGEGSIIYPNVFIGDNVKIGRNCIIYDSVSLRNAVLGDNCIIHTGARIGQDGFRYVNIRGKHLKIPQVGGVLIGNDVEIGANSTIDRGAIDDTVIGDMCKIDNLVQLGHNVILGKGCIVVAQTGISGSVIIGDYSMFGGQAGIAGHLRIGNNVQIAAQSGIMQDIPDNAIVMGTPAQPIKEHLRQVATLRKLVKRG